VSKPALTAGRRSARLPTVARRWGVAALALAMLLGVLAPQAAFGRKPTVPRLARGDGGPPTLTLHVSPACNHPYKAQKVADDLMADRYTFENEPTVILPPPEQWDWTDWTGDVVNRVNWRFQFHALVWVLALVDAWERTGEERYKERALFVVRSWVEHNPIDAPASPLAYYPHGIGLRAISLVCVAKALVANALPIEPWLQQALVDHGRTLRDPDYYLGHSNAAVNQSIGLLEIGCLLDRPNWQRVAEKRINTLVAESIDEQGVANEQSIWYQMYNHERYTIAEDRLIACARTVAQEFERVRRMPRFLGFATQPDGRYELIGDTMDRAAVPIPGTIAEFAATRGARGPRPMTTIAMYDAGYVFGRTGWGETRPIRDEISFALRFGPPQYAHGHFDSSSFTLYGHGSRLLLDPGFYGYEEGPWRPWFRSRDAHNVATTVTSNRQVHDSDLLRTYRDTHTFEALVRNRQLEGVSSTRRFIFSRVGGYVLVEDRVASNVSRDWRQLWHLRESSRPRRDGLRTWTQRPERGNVLIQQLLPGSQTLIARGQEKPRQGWLSYEYGELRPAPTVEFHQTGTEARYITLLAPFPRGTPPVVVSDVVITEDGFEATIRVRKVIERVVATAEGTTITPVK
jgi:hypothetical protein